MKNLVIVFFLVACGESQYPICPICNKEIVEVYKNKFSYADGEAVKRVMVPYRSKTVYLLLAREVHRNCYREPEIEPPVIEKDTISTELFDLNKFGVIIKSGDTIRFIYKLTNK